MNFEVNKVTPILTVDSIEEVLPFWGESLGYSVTVKVPDKSDKLGFAILEKNNTEIMLQTRKSGVLFPTEKDHHPSLAEQFPKLVPHPVLGKWLR